MVDSTGVSDQVAVLFQCFATIFAGYVSGRFGLISAVESRGLAAFVTYFSLPALIFNSLATINLSDISWNFIFGVFIAKTIVFCSVVLITLYLTKPSDTGLAGLYGIFCTQSNDFALGYPVIHSLYKDSKLGFANYLYVLLPIQLLILNPIGIIMLEFQKLNIRETKAALDHTIPKGSSMLISVLKGVASNPIIVMTFFGVLWNVTLPHEVPPILASFLTILANAFSATALFLLGNSMVGKFNVLRGDANLITPLILVTAKILILPLIIRFVVDRTVHEDDELYTDISQFSFLYGTIPTAPTVFIFAMQYGMRTDVVSTGLVIVTVLSAPLMFISANMIRLGNDACNYVADLGGTMSYMSVVTMPCIAWVIIVMIAGKRWKSVTQRCTLALAVSQLFVATGGFIWFYVDTNNLSGNNFTYRLHFIFVIAGCLSARIWTSVLAITLATIHWRSLSFAKRMHKRLMYAASSLVVLSTLIVIFCFRTDEQILAPTFQPTNAQSMTAIAFLVISLIVTMGSLLVKFRYAVKYESQEIEQLDASVRSIKATLTKTKVTRYQSNSITSHASRKPSVSATPSTSSVKVQRRSKDIVRSASRTSDDVTQTKRDSIHANNGDLIKQVILENVNRKKEDKEKMTFHAVLILFLIVNMMLCLTVSIGRTFDEPSTGIFLELEFLDIFFTFGQGIITFILFGIDGSIFCQIAKLLKKVIRRQSFSLPPLHELADETRHVCEQFSTYHVDKCSDEITIHLPVICDTQVVFQGFDLVEWLIVAGLAADRKLAVHYGRHLLHGRCIENATSTQDFDDSMSFYKFNIGDKQTGLTSFVDDDGLRRRTRSSTIDHLQESMNRISESENTGNFLV